MNLEASIGADIVSCYDKLSKIKKQKLLASIAVYCGKNNVTDELTNILRHVSDKEKSEISKKLTQKCFLNKNKKKEELLMVLCKEDKNFYKLNSSRILLASICNKNTIFLNWLCENHTNINDIFCTALTNAYYILDDVVWLYSQSKFIDIASGNNAIENMLKNEAGYPNFYPNTNTNKLCWILSQGIIELNNDSLKHYIELLAECTKVGQSEMDAVLNLICNQGKIDIRINDDIFTNCCNLIFMKKIKNSDDPDLRIINWFNKSNPLVYKCTIENPEIYHCMLTSYSIDESNKLDK
jgi:hypothetical protein